MALINNLREKGVVSAAKSATAAIVVDVESSPVAGGTSADVQIATTAALHPLPPDQSPPLPAGSCPSSACGCPTFYLDPYGNWACQQCEPPARPSMVRSRAMAVMLLDPLIGIESPAWVDAEAAIAAAPSHWESNARRSANELTTDASHQQTAAGDEPGGLDEEIGGLVELPEDLAEEFWSAIERERQRKIRQRQPAPGTGTFPAGSAATAAPAAASTEEARGRGRTKSAKAGSSRRGKKYFLRQETKKSGAKFLFFQG